jgi:pimeloyl-ACP methyl ester carboxylesterase
MVRKLLYLSLALFAVVVALILLLQVKAIPLAELEAKYMDANSQYIEVLGQKTHLRRQGSGRPLLLLHGTSSSLHTWDGWADLLEDSVEVIRVDMPGFGLTGPAVSGEYSPLTYVKWVHGLVEELAIDSFYLAGNSLGGYISWLYATEYPEDVRAMVLLDPSGIPSTSRPLIFKLARIPILRNIIKNISPRSLIEANILQVYANDSLVTHELVDRYYDLTLRKGNREVFIARANLPTSDYTQRLASIKTPTLIQWGAEDKWIPVTDAEVFDSMMVNSELVIYPNVGHVPMEEIPELTAKDAWEFLKQY